MPMVGTSVRRVEDGPLLRGRGRYVADLRLPGMLQATVVRSLHAHARLDHIDASAALGVPGVVAVFTSAEVKPLGRIPVRVGPRTVPPDSLQPPLAVDRVRYVGEPVALVVATDRYVAEDAAEAVGVDYTPLPPVLDARDALRAEAPRLHESAGGNLVHRVEVAKGDVEAALAAADRRLAERFAVQRHSGVPLETRGLVAAYDAGTRVLTLWGVAKVPHFNRTVLAELLGHPEALIRFVELHVGGGFGIRGEFYPEDFLVPWAAKRLGRPIQWIEDRREHFVAANHSREQLHEVEVGFRADGTILALHDRFLVDLGAYVRTNGLIPPELAAALLPGPYRIPHYRVEGQCVLTNKTPAGTYRGPGRFECTFVRERVVDLIARDLGLDPAEVRRRNFIQPDEMPYAVSGRSFDQQMTYDCGDYPRALDTALARLDYAAARTAQAAARREGRCVGVGLGCVVEKAGVGPWEYARVALEGDGRVTVYSGAASVGQGLDTVLAQICGDELSVGLDRIRVIHGDSDAVPYGGGAFASRGAMVAGGAVLEAARRLRAAIVGRAAVLLEADARDLVVDDGRVAVRGAPDRVVRFAELAAAASPDRPEPLVATHFFEAPRMSYPYGTHAAVVEVDAETGQVTILRYAIAFDVGRAINPMLVEGQMLGGLAQGIGGVLLEELAYDDAGQLLTGSFMDYPLPTATDMPAVTLTDVLEHTPTPLHPLGVKGGGEGGCSGASAALANAIADALGPLGVSVTALPLSPDRIRRLVRQAAGRRR